MAKPYITTDYYNLSHFIGEPLEIQRGADKICQYRRPEIATIIADYPKTVLLEMTFIKSEWGRKYCVPRKILKLIPKAVMAVGDVSCRVKSTGIYLVGNEITRYDYFAKECRL